MINFVKLRTYFVYFIIFTPFNFNQVHIYLDTNNYYSILFISLNFRRDLYLSCLKDQQPLDRRILLERKQIL
jgi:hypothetical protein